MKQSESKYISGIRKAGKLAAAVVTALLMVLSLASGCGDTTTTGDLTGDSADDVATDGTYTELDFPDVNRDTTDDADSTADWPAFPVQVNVGIKAADWKWLHDNPQSEKAFSVTLNLQGKTFVGTQMQIHGGYARTVPKLSFRFEIPDETATELNLFEDGPEQQRRFVLKSGWTDPTWLREYLTMDLIRRSGGFAPRISFAELWVNGQWQGLYLLVERIDRPYLKRQGLEEDNLNLFKAENHNANWRDKEDPLAGYDLQYGDPEHIEDLEKLLEACTATELTDEEFAEDVEPWLNLEDFTVFQRVRTFAQDKDTFTKNYYLYHDLSVQKGDADFPFRIINWDADATWGNNWDGKVIAADETKWYGHDTFAPRFLKVPKWRAHYIAEYRAALDTEFLPDALTVRVDKVAERIRNVVEKDLVKWDRGVSFDDELTRLRAAIQTRHTTMQGVLAGVD